MFFVFLWYGDECYSVTFAEYPSPGAAEWSTGGIAVAAFADRIKATAYADELNDMVEA